MIYTVTMNPSIDYYLTIDQPLIVNEVCRASNEIYKVGGKGINVSMVLNEMNIHSIALTFIGGFTGEYIKEKISEFNNIKLDYIPFQGNNRINVKIAQSNETISINGKGDYVNRENLDVLLSKLDQVTADDWVMVCGSLMGSTSSEILVEIANIIHKRKAKLIIDMESLSIEILELCKPDLIKPNLYEFKLISQSDIESDQDLKNAINSLLSKGVRGILLSQGNQGAIYATKNKFLRLRQPVIIAQNNVGMGDSMLAAFIGYRSEGASEEEAFRWSGAAGMATASTLDSVSIETIQFYYNQVSVIENSK